MAAVFLRMWNNFKTRPDIWFFGGFLLVFTLSVRKVFFFYPILNNFNEYTGIYLYLSDIFLILTILTWFYTILCNKNYKLSSYIQFFSQQETHVLILVLIVWMFMSIFWSGNTNLALFRALKLAEFGLFFLYITYNAFYNKSIIHILIRFIIILGFIQAIIGISQAILQHSVGIFLFKESLVSPNIDGVAKIVLFGHKFIRIYGLFPHPNIFGGFLLMSIVLTFVYGKIFYFDANKPKLSYKFKLFHVKQFEFLRNKILMYLILAIQIIALLLTFSKSAMLGLFCVVYYIGYKIVSHGTTTSVKKSIKNFWRYLIAIIIGLILLTILGFNINSLLLKSFNERLVYLIVSCETIINNPIVGVGIGNFVSEMQKYSPVFLTDWQYQPVHNVFLLIWSELGIVGLVLFILFLWKIFDFNSIVSHETISKKKKRVVFRAIMFGFVIIMLFDHYFWDIQQGQIMLWMVLGFLAGSSLALSLKTTAS